MYTLYHNKETMELKIRKSNQGTKSFPYLEDVTVYNSCYYSCLKRKPRKELAERIKEEWISEAEERLESLKSIKV